MNPAPLCNSLRNRYSKNNLTLFKITNCITEGGAG